MANIDLDSLTVGEVKKLCALVEGRRAPRRGKPFPFKVGDAVFIRTVTHHQTGRVVDVGRDWIKLEDAAWIADDGRFHELLLKGAPAAKEIEPFPSFVVVGRGAIIDMCPWPHPLPRDVK